MSRRSIAYMLAFACVTTGLAGCGLSVGESARRLTTEHSDLVDRVAFDSDWLDGAYLLVVLREGTTAADARRIWCDVIPDLDVPDGTSLRVQAGGELEAYWEAPVDCSDPSAMPSLAVVATS